MNIQLPPDKTALVLEQAGFAFLMTLFAVVLVFDILKLL